jgi:hypothetical protein
MDEMPSFAILEGNVCHVVKAIRGEYDPRQSLWQGRNFESEMREKFSTWHHVRHVDGSVGELLYNGDMESCLRSLLHTHAMPHENIELFNWDVQPEEHLPARGDWWPAAYRFSFKVAHDLESMDPSIVVGPDPVERAIREALSMAPFDKAVAPSASHPSGPIFAIDVHYRKILLVGAVYPNVRQRPPLIRAAIWMYWTHCTGSLLRRACGDGTFCRTAQARTLDPAEIHNLMLRVMMSEFVPGNPVFDTPEDVPRTYPKDRWK